MKKLMALSLASILILSCCKEPEPYVPFCEKNPDQCVDIREVKDWFYFKEGSYWIYEEETSGERDTLEVLTTYSNPETYYFSTRLVSVVDDYEYHYWSSKPASDNIMVEKDKRTTSVTRSKSKPGELVGESKCFLFYPSEGLWTYTNGGAPIFYDNVLKISDLYSELEISGRTFFDVFEVSEEHTIIENSQPTIHFYSKNIGLIKKELIDSNQIWNLVEFEIAE